MITLFTGKYGKISAGTSLNEGGKGKSALIIRPFTYGKYELYKNRDSFNLNGGQVIKSYYGLGTDLEKYTAASYALELTDKVIEEGLPVPAVFTLLTEFLDALEKRGKKHDTLRMAYVVKLLALLGMMPELDSCTVCGREINGPNEGAESAERDGAAGGRAAKKRIMFSPKEGGAICAECAAKARAAGNAPLIYEPDFDIVGILKYFRKNRFSAFEKLALDDAAGDELGRIMGSYVSSRFDIGKLKSEEFAENIKKTQAMTAGAKRR